MVELFIYDGSYLNRRGSHKYYPPRKDPIFQGFYQGLDIINPPRPFLIRTVFGDFKEPFAVKNTFDGKTLTSILTDTLKNGHDRSNNNTYNHDEQEFIESKGLNNRDMMWALKYYSKEEAMPYRFSDDDYFPQWRIHDLSLVIDATLYKATDKDEILFYQPDVRLRRKALLGIITSDANPRRPKIEPLRFNLTRDNLDAVIKKIRAKGYLK